MDKRIVNARLTHDGKEVLETVPPLFHEEFMQQFNALSADAQNTILASLQQVATMMDSGNYDAAPLLDINPPSS